MIRSQWKTRGETTRLWRKHLQTESSIPSQGCLHILTKKTLNMTTTDKTSGAAGADGARPAQGERYDGRPPHGAPGYGHYGGEYGPWGRVQPGFEPGTVFWRNACAAVWRSPMWYCVGRAVSKFRRLPCVVKLPLTGVLVMYALNHLQGLLMLGGLLAVVDYFMRHREDSYPVQQVYAGAHAQPGDSPSTACSHCRQRGERPQAGRDEGTPETIPRPFEEHPRNYGWNYGWLYPWEAAFGAPPSTSAPRYEGNWKKEVRLQVILLGVAFVGPMAFYRRYCSWIRKRLLGYTCTLWILIVFKTFFTHIELWVFCVT